MRLSIMVMLLWASAGNTITGDLNQDGTVDFGDFFMLADNFGKSGPLTNDCGSEFALPSEVGDLNGVLEPPMVALDYMSNWSGELFGRTKQWDGDIEDDGIELGWYYFAANDQQIFRSSNENVILKLNVRFFVRSGDGKKYDEPFYNKDFIIDNSVRTLQLPFEEYVPLIPTADLSDRVPVVVELRLIQSDGTVFADRETGSIATKG